MKTTAKKSKSSARTAKGSAKPATRKPAAKRTRKQTAASAPTGSPVAVVSPDVAQAFGMDKLPASLVRITDTPAPAPITIKLAEPERVTAPYKIDITKGADKWDVSRQWASRPDDERFTCFEDLYAAAKARREYSRETLLDLTAIQCDGGDIKLTLPGIDEPITPSHYAFNQLCAAARVPAPYLSTLPGDIAAINLRHGMASSKQQQIKTLTYHVPGRPVELAAITSPTYGRIWDLDIIEIVKYLLTIDPTWKIPGEMNWADMTHNPYVEITKDNTSLFWSKQNCFMFFCKDDRPIECGKTSKGDPDMWFPGCWFWNSEQGDDTVGIATMMLRGVCMNRSLRGVEGFHEVKIRHSKNAPERFQGEALKTIKKLHDADPRPFIGLIASARQKTLAANAEEAVDFLRKRSFNAKETAAIVEASIREEEREPRTVFDFSTAITAYSRTIANQDRRTTLERIGSDLLQLAA